MHYGSELPDAGKSNHFLSYHLGSERACNGAIGCAQWSMQAKWAVPSKWMSEQVSEQASETAKEEVRAWEQANELGSKWASEPASEWTSKPVNGQASSPILTSVFLDATSHLYKRSCPSVRLSVRLSVPCYFRMTKNVISEASMTLKFTKE